MAIATDINNDGIASWVAEKWRYLKNERLIKERIWNECELAFACKFGDTWADVAEYRSQRYLGVINEAVETWASKTVQGVMPYDDYVDISPVSPDDDPKARMLKSLVMWQTDKTQFRAEFSKLIKAAAIFGNVPYCIDWCEETIEVPDHEAYAAQMMSAQMGGEVAEGMPTKRVRRYSGPKLRVGNIYDYVQELRPSNPKYAMRISRTFATKSYLLSKAESGEGGWAMYDKQAIENLSNSNIFKTQSDTLQLSKERQEGITQGPKDMIELLQVEGDFEINGKFYENHILVVGNQSQVLRFEPNPFFHGMPQWNLFVLQPEPNEVYGRGIVEANLGLNDAIQVRLNQVIEANSLCVNPMFKVVRDGITDVDDLEVCPGAMIETANPENIQPLIVPSQASLGMQEIGYLTSQLTNISGATADLSQFGTKPVSATEASITAGMANARTIETLRHIESTLLVPMFEMWVSMNQQLMDQPMWLRLVQNGVYPGLASDPDTGVSYQMGPQTILVRPEDIAAEFDIRVKGSSETYRNAQQLGQIMQLTSGLMQIPVFQQFIKPDGFLDAIYKIAGIRDAWRWVKSPQEVMIEQQQQQQLALQQQIQSEVARGTALRDAGLAPEGGQGGSPSGTSKPGPEPGPQGVASVAGVPETGGLHPGGSAVGQMEGSRLA